MLPLSCRSSTHSSSSSSLTSRRRLDKCRFCRAVSPRVSSASSAATFAGVLRLLTANVMRPSACSQNSSPGLQLGGAVTSEVEETKKKQTAASTIPNRAIRATKKKYHTYPTISYQSNPFLDLEMPDP